MDKPGLLSARVKDGIAVAAIGSPERIHFDPEIADCLYDTLNTWASDENVRVVILTGDAPGYFIRHYSVAAIIAAGEAVCASGRTPKENDETQFFSFDHAIGLCETMPKPVIAAISGTCMGGAYEMALGCDLRIAEDGPYQIGLPEVNLGILPGAGGTQRLPRLIGPGAALAHILLGEPLDPREAERRGFVHQTVEGKALDRALEIAQRLRQLDAPALAHIKRLVRGALDRPLADGLKLERNLFMMLASSDAALARMRAYEAGNLAFSAPD